MKKILCVLLMAGLLAGCGKQDAQATEATVPETAETAVITAPEMTETEETTVPEMTENQDSAVYEIIPEDRSLRNDNGDTLVESIYDKVTLPGGGEVAAAINGAVDADCERFFAESGAVDYYEPEDFEQMIRDMGMSYGDLFHNANATVTHNSGGMLSIRVSTGWFLGGVFNADHYGMTFDLQTGEKVPLEQLSELPAEEWEELLKQITIHWAVDTYGEGLFQSPEEVLAEYSLQDLMYYVEEGQIILTFPTYTFAAGAAGSAMIPTGILIETAD